MVQIIALSLSGSSNSDEGSNEEDGEDELNALGHTENHSISGATAESNDEA